MKKRIWGQILRFLGTAAVVLLLVFGAVKVCNYLLVDDSTSYTRLMMHEMYEAEENIDTLFLGSSHCYRAYDPALFTELTGKSSFNVGSSGQHYDTSYYLLREVVKYHDVKRVYLDMHYKFFYIGKENRDLVQANIISDYMRPSLNKLEFLTQTSETKHITSRMLPFRRDWQKLADLPYLRDVWSKKQAESYKTYAPLAMDGEYYAGKGFVWSDGELVEEEITWWEKYREVGSIAMDMDSEETYSLSYIGKIVEFCEEQGIELVFVTAPSYERYLEEIGPYDQAYEFVKNMADEYGVLYWDFNLCKEEYLTMPDDNFIDIDHLNGKGAQQLTRLLAELDEKLSAGDFGADDIDEYFNPCYDMRE